MSQARRRVFFSGIKDGIPIALGYLSVSFGFGITAVSNGLTIFAAVLISMTNLTSAGQVAGLTVIASNGGMIEMAVAQFVINLRYSLMSLSLSQKLDKGFTPLSRLAASFGITDEIFAVASGRSSDVSKHYMAGLISLPWVGWALGTFLGAAAGQILPEKLKAALGIAIYGMFVAIFVPAARKAIGVLIVVIIAVTASCCLKYIPLFSGISEGFAIIICTVLAAVIGAIFFPVKQEEGGTEE